MKMPLNSSQTIAAVAIAVALAAGAYAVGRSSTPEPLAVAEKVEKAEKAATVPEKSKPAPVRAAVNNGNTSSSNTSSSNTGSSNTGSSKAASARLCDECYRVVGVRSEERKGEGSGLGAVGGALIGGLLGNQVGGGTGKKIATVGGAVAGGMAGNEIERRNKSERVWIVQMVNRDGRTENHQQSRDPEVRDGDVIVLRDGQIQRR